MLFSTIAFFLTIVLFNKLIHACPIGPPLCVIIAELALYPFKSKLLPTMDYNIPFYV